MFKFRQISSILGISTTPPNNIVIVPVPSVILNPDDDLDTDSYGSDFSGSNSSDAYVQPDSDESVDEFDFFFG